MHKILPKLAMPAMTVRGLSSHLAETGSQAAKKAALNALSSGKAGAEAAVLHAGKITAKQSLIGAGALSAGTLALGGYLVANQKPLETEVKAAPVQKEESSVQVQKKETNDVSAQELKEFIAKYKPKVAELEAKAAAERLAAAEKAIAAEQAKAQKDLAIAAVGVAALTLVAGLAAAFVGSK